MAPSSPTLARWELALRLRERRLQLGMNVKRITERLDFSRNYWSAVENNRTILAEDKLKVLIELFELNDREAEELIALREAGKERGWWAHYSAQQLDDEMKRLYGLEHGARSMQAYDGGLINGLLQTEDYARVVIASEPLNSPVMVEQLVDIRLRRQERLRGNDPLRLTALMGEAALLQQTGEADVLLGQLVHLVSMIEELSETLAVHILPFDTPPGGLHGSQILFLLHFDNPRLPTAVWQESTVNCSIIEDEDVVRRLRLTYRQALDRSLDREESMELIRCRAKELS